MQFSFLSSQCHNKADRILLLVSTKLIKNTPACRRVGLHTLLSVITTYCQTPAEFTFHVVIQCRLSLPYGATQPHCTQVEMDFVVIFVTYLIN